MLTNQFETILASDLDQCLDYLADHAGEAAVMAGGTDLFVLMRAGLKMPRFVISIGTVPGLGEVKVEGETVTLGATLTHRDLIGLDALRDVACLTTAAGSIGSPQVRNVGTLGGNVANASPAGDLLPPLLVLDAAVTLRSKRGKRRVKLEDVTTGPGMTTIEPDELLTAVDFRRPRGTYFSAYTKIGLRKALAVSVASVAIVAGSDRDRFGEVRIGCGAVAPRPIRMPEVERLLEGEKPTAELTAEAGLLAARACDPMTDIRATKEYRRHVTGVVVSRLVEKAAAELLGYKGGVA